MEYKDGTAIKIGDIVDISQNASSKLASYKIGIVGEIDRRCITPDNITVIACDNNMPFPIPQTPSMIYQIQVSDVEKNKLNSVLDIFNEMSREMMSV